MTQVEYLTEFQRVLDRMLDTTRRKNADYAEEKDAFSTFRLIEQLTEGRVSAEDGVLVRMTDKLCRIAHLLGREAQVPSETVEDTAIDLSVYSIILMLVRRAKRGTPKSIPVQNGTITTTLQPPKWMAARVADDKPVLPL